MPCPIPSVVAALCSRTLRPALPRCGFLPCVARPLRALRGRRRYAARVRAPRPSLCSPGPGRLRRPPAFPFGPCAPLRGSVASLCAPGSLALPFLRCGLLKSPLLRAGASCAASVARGGAPWHAFPASRFSRFGRPSRGLRAAPGRLWARRLQPGPPVPGFARLFSRGGPRLFLRRGLSFGRRGVRC